MLCLDKQWVATTEEEIVLFKLSVLEKREGGGTWGVGASKKEILYSSVEELSN